MIVEHRTDLSDKRIAEAVAAVFDRYPNTRLSLCVIQVFVGKDLGVYPEEVREAYAKVENHLRTSGDYHYTIGKGGGWSKPLIDHAYKATLEARLKKIERKRSKA